MALFGLKKKPSLSKEDLDLAQTREKVKATLGRGMVDVKDIIAPPALQVDFDHVRVGETFYRTLFISGYPRFVGANWLAPIINFDHTLDIAFYYYPVEAKGILDDLRRKIAEMQATVQGDFEKGHVIDPAVRIALEDAQGLQNARKKLKEKNCDMIVLNSPSTVEADKISASLLFSDGSALKLGKISKDAFAKKLCQTILTKLFSALKIIPLFEAQPFRSCLLLLPHHLYLILIKTAAWPRCMPATPIARTVR